MPFFAKDESAIEELKKDTEDEDIISDEELRELIKPEIVTLNVPAILEIIFGLFLLFAAILEFGYYYGGLGTEYMILGIAFIVAMLLSFFAAYGMILKSKIAGFLGAGKGVFFIFYFLYAVLDWRRLAQEAVPAKTLAGLGDLNRQAIYEMNMLMSALLLIFVLLLTLSIFHKLYKDGHLDAVFRRRGVPTQAVNSVATLTEIKNE
jgi:hypothetical protein